MEEAAAGSKKHKKNQKATLSSLPDIRPGPLVPGEPRHWHALPGIQRLEVQDAIRVSPEDPCYAPSVLYVPVTSWTCSAASTAPAMRKR